MVFLQYFGAGARDRAENTANKSISSLSKTKLISHYISRKPKHPIPIVFLYSFGAEELEPESEPKKTQIKVYHI